MKAIAGTAMLVILTGCSAATVHRAGQDTYYMTDAGSWMWASGAPLNTNLLMQASMFCKKQGKELANTKSKQDGSGWEKSANDELQFQCISTSDPALRKAN